MAQMINGKSYEQGTPEWQRAMEEDRVRQAGIAGTAAGTEEGNAAVASGGARGKAATDTLTAMGLNIKDFMGGGSEFNASGGGGGNGGGPTVSGLSAAATGPMAQLAPVDTTASDAAIFGRAKDKVGQETSSALTGLRSALAGRGLLGSGAESRGTTSVITKGQQQLGDTTRQQAITGAENEQQSAETNLGAAVTQRGQNIQALESQNNLELQRAQFNLQSRQQSLQGLMAALSLAKGSY